MRQTRVFEAKQLATQAELDKRKDFIEAEKMELLRAEEETRLLLTTVEQVLTDGGGGSSSSGGGLTPAAAWRLDLGGTHSAAPSSGGSVCPRRRSTARHLRVAACPRQMPRLGSRRAATRNAASSEAGSLPLGFESDGRGFCSFVFPGGLSPTDVRTD